MAFARHVYGCVAGDHMELFIYRPAALHGVDLDERKQLGGNNFTIATGILQTTHELLQILHRPLYARKELTPRSSHRPIIQCSKRLVRHYPMGTHLARSVWSLGVDRLLERKDAFIMVIRH